MKTGEKLALAIRALQLISGDPELDAMVLKLTGVDNTKDPSIRMARRTLATIGAWECLAAPVAQRMDQ